MVVLYLPTLQRPDDLVPYLDGNHSDSLDAHERMVVVLDSYCDLLSDIG